MKLLDYLVIFLGKTVGSAHLPFVDKKFPLKDYFEIEKYLRQLNNPFVVGLVKTNGHGSNLLISITQLFSKKKCSKVVHAFAHIGIYGGFKHRTVEALNEGIVEQTLLRSIGQRDNVVLRKPNLKLINENVCNHAIEYIYEVIKRDNFVNIPYDQVHNYDIITIEQIKDYKNKIPSMDCSELIMQSLEHGFRMTNQKSLIKMVNRLGKSSWTPADIYFSDLFETFYDSKKGFIDGDLC